MKAAARKKLLRSTSEGGGYEEATMREHLATSGDNGFGEAISRSFDLGVKIAAMKKDECFS